MKNQQLINIKNRVYQERNICVAAIAHMILEISKFADFNVGVAQHIGKNCEDDWRTIVVITHWDERNPDQKIKQITWHFHDSEKYLLDGLPRITNYIFDGHNTQGKYQRLIDFVTTKKIKIKKLISVD